jgi:hypothetical protein
MEAIMLHSLIAQTLPQQTQLLTDLINARILFPIALCAIGALLMAYGFKAYKWIVLSNFIAVGWWLGPLLVKNQLAGKGGDDLALVASIAGAVVMGLIASPLLRYTVAACGGMVGFIIGMVAWAYCDQPMNMNWAGGLMGMAVLGMLSFVLFKTTVILFTSIEGAALFVFGACALILRYQPWQEQVNTSLATKPVLLPLAIVTLTVIALFWQHQQHGLIGHEGAPAAGKAGGASSAEAKKK